MSNKNKKKQITAIALFMILCLCVSGFCGTLFAKKSLGVSENTTATIGNDEQGDIVITLNPVPEYTDGGYDTTEIFVKVNPSVVSIKVYDDRHVLEISEGTGIIMTEDGYILTNAHVVDEGSRFSAILYDGTEYDITIIGMDADTDLAVVKADAKGLCAAEFGDSNSLLIGERVVAIGNAGGLSSTCTQGIISGLNRDIDENYRALKLIQTSAAINPGNSGGPLVNRFGQVIGITSSKIASVDYEGIGFAIPITDALPLIQSMIKNGYVAGRPALGISVLELNEDNSKQYGRTTGSVVKAINEDSNMARAGVEIDDVIIEINGIEVTSNYILLDEIDKCAPGDTVELVLYRPSTGKTFTAKVVLIEYKS